MPALHTMKFHDITHTLESVGYRLNPDGDGFTVNEPDPRKIIDTLRLTQDFGVLRIGFFYTLILPNDQVIYIYIYIDADQFGTRIHEPEHN